MKVGDLVMFFPHGEHTDMLGLVLLIKGDKVRVAWTTGGRSTENASDLKVVQETP